MSFGWLRKINRLEVCEQISLALLLTAITLNLLSAVSRSWFELPGVAWYGLWTGDMWDWEERHYMLIAFFSKEPGEYHVLQLIFVLSWAALGLSVWILVSEKAIQKIPRCLRKTRQHTVALFCFASAFAINGGLYYFYHMLYGFSPDSGNHPVMKWGGKAATAACILQMISGMFLI